MTVQRLNQHNIPGIRTGMSSAAKLNPYLYAKV
jgi:hypothetical protein